MTTETVDGELVFESLMPIAAYYVGLPFKFKQGIKLTVKDRMVRKIDGGAEAKALDKFLATIKPTGRGAERYCSESSDIETRVRITARLDCVASSSASTRSSSPRRPGSSSRAASETTFSRADSAVFIQVLLFSTAFSGT